MPQEIVLGRLRGRIRRLFDVGAVVRVEDEGTGGRGGLWFHLNRAYIAIEPKSFCAAVEYAFPQKLRYLRARTAV